MHKYRITKKWDPPLFQPSYYQTRRWLGIFSGLLIAWQFVGIEPHDQSKPIVPSINLRFSEETYENGIPIVLAIGVVYLIFRYIIEWNQANLIRRNLPSSKFDRLFTLFIGGFSFLSFLLRILYDYSLYQYWKLLLPLAVVYFTKFVLIENSVYCFNYFINNHGDKKMAGRKLRQLLALIVFIVTTLLLLYYTEAILEFTGAGPNEDPDPD